MVIAFADTAAARPAPVNVVVVPVPMADEHDEFEYKFTVTMSDDVQPTTVGDAFDAGDAGETDTSPRLSVEPPEDDCTYDVARSHVEMFPAASSAFA